MEFYLAPVLGRMRAVIGRRTLDQNAVVGKRLVLWRRASLPAAGRSASPAAVSVVVVLLIAYNNVQVKRITPRPETCP